MRSVVRRLPLVLTPHEAIGLRPFREGGPGLQLLAGAIAVVAALAAAVGVVIIARRRQPA